MWVLVKFKWSTYRRHLEFYYIYIYIYMNTCKTCAISLKITCKAFLLCHTMIMSQSYTSWENNLIFFNVKTIVELVFLHLNWFKYFSVLSWGKLYRLILFIFSPDDNCFFFFKKKIIIASDDIKEKEIIDTMEGNYLIEKILFDVVNSLVA
jgi:hypothetical protein